MSLQYEPSSEPLYHPCAVHALFFSAKPLFVRCRPSTVETLLFSVNFVSGVLFAGAHVVLYENLLLLLYYSQA